LAFDDEVMLTIPSSQFCLLSEKIHLQSNREEKLLNVDCQIRGKADIHEALATMCETEIMEGNNQVFCDNCKKNTDTVLRTAISELPNMLILSLKRFDLDYNTFETVKLNSRCAFGQTLNMKRYTLEGVEALEKQSQENQESDAMDIGNDEAALRHIPDEDYEYKLAGVLVHSGVAQGGHYYSFIKDRNPGASEKWYRFDDEDVTSFDPTSIETECFGGKVKKETKWPNGQVHTVESEQFANALMLFYEKVKVTEQPPAPQTSSDEEDGNATEKEETPDKNIVMTSGYDVFEPDVSRSNATHRWQSFLFDKHFQTFLRGLLGLCKISFPERDGELQTEPPPAALKAIQGPWRRDVLQMLVGFMFDVYLYGEDKDSINEWLLMTEEILEGDYAFARDFVDVLARRSKSVNDNWFRTYLLDCPDADSQNFGARVFSKAFCSAAMLAEEETKLMKWTEAWTHQVNATKDEDGPFPVCLLGKWSEYEDLAASSSSSMGILLSHLNELIDASTRVWKFNINFSRFTQFVAQGWGKDDDSTLRHAITACLIPARLICLAGRGHMMSEVMRVKFPAASASRDVAETQIRQEQHPQPMITHNQVMLHHSNQNYRGGRDWLDYAPIVYTLGFLLGIPGLLQAEITIEQGDQSRGRQRRILSPAASNALRQIFMDLCTEGSPGMSKQEIETHLLKSNVDVPGQKILDLMSKYPATNDGIAEQQYLSLDGFLAYYRDVAVEEDFRVSLACVFAGIGTGWGRRCVYI
jgi:ubiquitin carboxyl-terminal hydrolase 9/24